MPQHDVHHNPQSIAQRIYSLIATHNVPQDDLASALENTSVMTSAFGILDGMKSPTPDTNIQLEDDIFSDTSSVMLYSPLLPSTTSLVELADTDVVEEYDEPEPEPAPPIPGWSWSNVVSPIAAWINSDGNPLTPRSQERHLRTTRVWIPSKDKLSFQAMWWGYRLFLPPPILDILDDKQLEAARRASMITTALTWFFNNLPVSTFPVPMQPILILIQRIAPCLGYIGTFISWSWSSVKTYDQGFGVILTATWLLPIALIPGTWYQRDWPITPPSLPLELPLEEPSPPTPHIPAPMTPAPPSVPMIPQDLPLSPSSELSYATAPTSPAIASPPVTSSPSSSFSYTSTSTSSTRFKVSLASLVARTPTIRSHRISKSLHLISSPLATSTPITSPPHNPSSLDTTASYPIDTSPYPSPTSINDNSNDHYYSSQHQYPSPPADPNDLSLLQSPLVPCSPLPDEDAQHPALPSTSTRKKKGKGKLKSLFKGS